MLPLVIGEIVSHYNFMRSIFTTSVHYQALGLEHLHDSGIIHHDIKPDNILIDKEGHCVITDFGAARFLRKGRLERMFNEIAPHTPGYSAPELLIQDDYDASVDYWSLGATIVELILGEDVRTSSARSLTSYVLIYVWKYRREDCEVITLLS